MKRTIPITTIVVLLLCLIAALPAGAVSCTGVNAWAPGTNFTVGELTTFNGIEYKCIQAHTSIVSWEPPNVPALFTPIGACGSGGGATPTPTPKGKPSPTPTPKGKPSPTPTATPNPPPPPPPTGKLFAPYIDMSLNDGGQIVSIASQSGIRAFTLAFLIEEGGCNVGWGGLGGILPNDNLPDGTSMATLVSQLQSNGVQVIISFGGAAGIDPAGLCSSPAALQAVYQSVLNRYHVKALDFDIEGAAVENQPAITQRDLALRGLRSANSGLVISYTIPVLPTGLVASGVSILNSARKDGFTPNVINIMTMDYGGSFDGDGQNQGTHATNAANATHGQIGAAGLGSTVGITPMIGVNDDSAEVFRMSDANTVVNFAKSNGFVTRIAMWSVGRDNGSCAGAGFASATCSGLSQGNWAFAKVFEGF